MESRFVVLSLLTGLFQIICGITLVIGIGMLISAGQTHPAYMQPNPFTGGPIAGIEVLGGAALVLYGLTGLVFSGGISVLIAIDKSTHETNKQIAAALSRLAAPASTAPTVVSYVPPPEVPVAAKPAAPAKVTCPVCETVNPASNRFCEACGAQLSKAVP